MRFSNSITAKVLVWLAAILVPAQTLPLMACDCGSHSPRSMAVKADRADAAPAAKCPHCTSGSRPRHSCCGGTAASSGQHGSCCGAKGSCCCKGGLGSHGGPCLCSVNKSAPAPDPLPSNSRTDNTKSSLGSSSDTVATVAVVVPSVVLAQAAQQPSLLGSTSLERLSTLCRLVI
jgi:hypothetical protein